MPVKEEGSATFTALMDHIAATSAAASTLSKQSPANANTKTFCGDVNCTLYSHRNDMSMEAVIACIIIEAGVKAVYENVVSLPVRRFDGCCSSYSICPQQGHMSSRSLVKSRKIPSGKSYSSVPRDCDSEKVGYPLYRPFYCRPFISCLVRVRQPLCTSVEDCTFVAVIGSQLAES